MSYALFFTLLLAGVGVIFREFLTSRLEANIRDSLDQEWGALHGFLQLKNGKYEWFYDPDDPDEDYIVRRLQQVYLLADAQGSVMQASETYASIGEDTPDEVRAALKSREATWRVKKNPQGADT